PASDSEPEDVIEVEDTVEPDDETVPASVHEIGESSIATFLQEDGDRLMPNEWVERDLYWTSVQAHEFYREMIRRGVVFEERPNKAIDFSV
nr:hypothetical protein [Tanacetum cinerariifolium]